MLELIKCLTVVTFEFPMSWTMRTALSSTLAVDLFFVQLFHRFRRLSMDQVWRVSLDCVRRLRLNWLRRSVWTVFGGLDWAHSEILSQSLSVQIDFKISNWPDFDCKTQRLTSHFASINNAPFEIHLKKLTNFRWKNLLISKNSHQSETANVALKSRFHVLLTRQFKSAI